jgi:hypothetical protein
MSAYEFLQVHPHELEPVPVQEKSTIEESINEVVDPEPPDTLLVNAAKGSRTNPLLGSCSVGSCAVGWVFFSWLLFGWLLFGWLLFGWLLFGWLLFGWLLSGCCPVVVWLLSGCCPVVVARLVGWLLFDRLVGCSRCCSYIVVVVSSLNNTTSLRTVV